MCICELKSLSQSFPAESNHTSQRGCLGGRCSARWGTALAVEGEPEMGCYCKYRDHWVKNRAELTLLPLVIQILKTEMVMHASLPELLRFLISVIDRNVQSAV